MLCLFGTYWAAFQESLLGQSFLLYPRKNAIYMRQLQGVANLFDFIPHVCSNLLI